MHLQSGLLNPMDRAEQVAVPVLHLVGLDQTLLIGCFDADEDLSSGIF